ncbi:MAG: DUF6036 family nucleotidyltransferase [Bdellovibrionota bacterium]
MKLLNDRSVEYVVIGASAFPTHGYSRSTLDIDIFIRPTIENAKATLQSLQEFGYDTEDLTAQDLLENKVLIRQYMVETDIHPFVAGTTFDEVNEGKVYENIEGIRVAVAGLDELIKMKKAANRPKDQEDLKFLEQIKKTKK